MSGRPRETTGDAGRASAETAPAGTARLHVAPVGRMFAHESEAELARILDFYAVRWEYEPHTYPILWNLDGSVLESFSPDFYLPEMDVYLELTTLRQKLVRKKNRKLRRLRELYPDIRIKLFYARDFRMLMLKYGKLALVDALSGTPGQMVPPARARRPSEGGESGPSATGRAVAATVEARETRPGPGPAGPEPVEAAEQSPVRRTARAPRRGASPKAAADGQITQSVGAPAPRAG